MNAVAFDTLKLARSLREKAKLTPEQAEGFADAISEAMQGDLATKGDLQVIQSDLQAVRSDLRSELRETELRLNAQIEATKTQIEATKSDLLKWMVGSVGLQTVVILGALIALARTIHP